MYDEFATWIAEHRDWVDDLAWLRANALGFSFTSMLEPPADTAGAYVNLPATHHLRVTRAAEHVDDLVTYREYAERWERYEGGRAEYVGLGTRFLLAVANPETDVDARRGLLVASEADDHLCHNAAVL